jgi:hypothetical protein
MKTHGGEASAIDDEAAKYPQVGHLALNNKASAKGRDEATTAPKHPPRAAATTQHPSKKSGNGKVSTTKIEQKWWQSICQKRAIAPKYPEEPSDCGNTN